MSCNFMAREGMWGQLPLTFKNMAKTVVEKCNKMSGYTFIYKQSEHF